LELSALVWLQSQQLVLLRVLLLMELLERSQMEIRQLLVL
jgi:hypothetical protein